MEDLDSRLFITGIEVSCWQDQLRQAVSIYFALISKSFCFNFYLRLLILIINISFWFTQILITHDQIFMVPNFTLWGFAETILTPLQTSSVLIKADR